MSTTSQAIKCDLSNDVCQGDIFQNVKYNYIEYENEDDVSVIEYIFPYAIVISQGCDAISMSEMVRTGRGKGTKFMPSILMCPIYDETMAKEVKHIDSAFSKLNIQIDKEQLFNSDERKIVLKDWHYRYHALNVMFEKDEVFSKCIIDFKHYFTVPMSYLVNNRQNRKFRLDDIYAEQITLKFATYLSRVAMPG